MNVCICISDHVHSIFDSQKSSVPTSAHFAVFYRKKGNNQIIVVVFVHIYTYILEVTL